MDTNSSMDIERMMLDGNLNNGPRLKFVSVSDSRVQDPTNNKNGLVEVEFYKETRFIYTYTYQPIMYSNYIYTYQPDNSSSSNYRVYYNDGTELCSCDCQTGATICGEESNQKYSLTADFATDPIPVVLSLRLKGKSDSLTVKDTKHKYCINCGKKNPYRANYCMYCGFNIK